ncbi:MAG: SDR family NAD(P)-dependent oxidoreductase [Roseiflexaceae bacterium]
MNSYQGKTALITGASSGIGEGFARELARRGMHLILVARSAGRLQQLADELSSRHRVQVTVLPFDLGQERAGERVYEAVAQRGLRVDLLVNNAGFGTHGRFEELDPARDHQQVMVNVTAVVDLTHAFVPDMLARGSGAVINVASTVSYQPTPYMAVYGASKAFVTSFSAALAEEYRGRGLRVLALCPGATATGFFDAVGGDSFAFGRMRTPAQVVATALRALERGQSVVVDGLFNALVAEFAKRMSFAFSARVAGRVTRPVPTGRTS